ncbi:MAG: hypothetical protein WC776_05115 [Patescibacteria group bacterium]|jgi:hypothetical protein
MEKPCMAVIASIKSLADGSWRVVLDLNEIDSLTLAEITSDLHKAGQFQFKSTE